MEKSDKLVDVNRIASSNISYSVFNEEEFLDYAKISRLRNKAGELFIDYLLSLLKSSNSYMRWLVIKELQILGGQKLLGDRKKSVISSLKEISKNDHETISLSKKARGVPQYYIDYTDNQKVIVQISEVARQTINIILSQSQFLEPLLYFENLDHEDLWGELAGSLYIKKGGNQKYWIENAKKGIHTDFAHFVNEAFSAIASFDYFYSCVVNHGIFADRFFEIGISQALSNELTKQTYSLDLYKKLVSDHYVAILGHERNVDYLSNYSSLASAITSQLTTQYIFDIINDSEKMKGADAWWIKYKRKRKCIFCGQEFSLITLPDWVYFGSNGFKRCCFHCKIVQFPNDTEVGLAVRDFLDICGFIPYSDFHPAKYSFTSRLTQEQWIIAIRAYANMGGINYLRKKYGSWINCLLETGALPEGVRVGKRGVYCLAKDGHLCNSLAEQQIDNWLSDNNIVHDKEPLYPYHPELNPNRKKRADWIVGEKMIEFFGLPEDPSYAKRMSEKISLAKTFKLELLSIFPKDLSNLKESLQKLL